jgi:DNA-binding PadR family transcriptional regulator
MSATMGEFERAVLLAVSRLGEAAYGMKVRRELEHRLRRNVSIGAVYTTLDRMEEKGFVSSWVGEPTAERGGRAKKFFRVEAPGVEALNRTKEASDAVWALLPASTK